MEIKVSCKFLDGELHPPACKNGRMLKHDGVPKNSLPEPANILLVDDAAANVLALRAFSAPPALRPRKLTEAARREPR